jgi:hypothetical protein
MSQPERHGFSRQIGRLIKWSCSMPSTPAKDLVWTLSLPLRWGIGIAMWIEFIVKKREL